MPYKLISETFLSVTNFDFSIGEKHGAEIGFLPKQKIGVIVLTNEENKGFPDAIGLWTFDRLLGNPPRRHMEEALTRAKLTEADEAVIYERPAAPRPPPDLNSLAGHYKSDEMGSATLAAEAGGLVATLRETGANLRLDPFDGAVFTLRLVPEGRFAVTAASAGDKPLGFADFESDAAGRLTALRWTIDGQPYLWRKDSAATEPHSPPDGSQ